MKVYLETYPNPASWMDPIETMYQSLAGGPGSSLTPKLPHLTDWDALFLCGLVRMPRTSRPHGIITWRVPFGWEAFRLSRTSIYALGERINGKLFGEVEQSGETEEGHLTEAAERVKTPELIEVTPNRLRRTILRAMFPGNMSIRPTQAVVDEALESRPSVGYISELRVEAGHRARQFLRQLDYSNIGHVIVGRDETFFQGAPILIVIEPVSMTILLAEVCADRQAETWGTALQLVQDQGVSIAGLIEDMARNYEKSQKLANLADVAVQKDPWHLMHDSAQLLTTLEKAAYRAMQQLLDLEKRLNQTGAASDFALLRKAVAAEAKAIEQYDAYAPLHAHLCDAFEMVDWRAGEIRDPITASWFLDAVLDEMALCSDTRILSFLKTLRNHRPYLLTFLNTLHEQVRPWRNDLWLHLRQRDQVLAFEQCVAQHWWCQQKLIANHKQWHPHADECALRLAHWTAHDDHLAALASRLMRIFDQAGRTNSVTESINGLLKSFLNSRQSFQSTDSMQAYLDLFVLWHNTRTFERGKRQGQSPFQITGVHTASDDWIDLLGY